MCPSLGLVELLSQTGHSSSKVIVGATETISWVPVVYTVAQAVLVYVPVEENSSAQWLLSRLSPGPSQLPGINWLGKPQLYTWAVLSSSALTICPVVYRSHSGFPATHEMLLIFVCAAPTAMVALRSRKGLESVYLLLGTMAVVSTVLIPLLCAHAMPWSPIPTPPALPFPHFEEFQFNAKRFATWLMPAQVVSPPESLVQHIEGSAGAMLDSPVLPPAPARARVWATKALRFAGAQIYQGRLAWATHLLGQFPEPAISPSITESPWAKLLIGHAQRRPTAFLPEIYADGTDALLLLGALAMFYPLTKSQPRHSARRHMATAGFTLTLLVVFLRLFLPRTFTTIEMLKLFVVPGAMLHLMSVAEAVQV